MKSQNNHALRFVFASILAWTACVSGSSNESAWDAALTIATVPAVTIAETQYNSSTTLVASWTAAPDEPDHYVLSATESGQSLAYVSTEVAGDTTSGQLSGLKSDTIYDISLVACADASCEDSSEPGDAASAEGTTPEEVWQLQGSGASVDELTQVVADGNSKIAAMFYGEDAEASLAGQVQLYYGPLGFDEKGLAIGLGSGNLRTDASAAFSFTALSGESGLITPATAATYVDTVNTGQAVPMSAQAGGYIRLYFESTGSDDRTRIVSIDSVDGYVGQDFNSSPDEQVCSDGPDYEIGGDCGVTVAIGVQTDSTLSNPNITDARQFKIAWPTLDDWRWDQAVGTFMILTVDTDRESGCSDVMMKAAYAVWDGSSWVVQYDDTTGCPKLFESVQAPTPEHLGGVRYKLYFGDPSQTEGEIEGSQLPFPGPKLIIYADGTTSGDSTIVDYEDWEDVSVAHDITFLWPDGSVFDDTDEGYIDDFMMLAPTQDLDFQVAYIAITEGSTAPISAGALLMNP